jgi:predicted nucleic acid-binding protein
MATYTAILDACILYSAALRDLLMRMAVNDVFKPKWTNQILDEWIRNLRANRPELPAERLERTRQLMNLHIDDALVEGYEPLIETLALPDPDDRHVLAAAIHGRADAIVTYNTKHFPDEIMARYDIELLSPDAFISVQFDLNHPAMAQAIREHRASLKSPPKTPEQYLEDLERQGLTMTAYEIKSRAIF